MKMISFHNNVKQHNNIDNNQKCFLSSISHIRLISEGSCDTEGWSNDAENSALHHRNKLHITIY